MTGDDRASPTGCRLRYLTAREARAVEAAVESAGTPALAGAVRSDRRGRERLTTEQFREVLACLRDRDREDLIEPAFESNLLWIEREHETELDPELRGLFEYLY